MRSLDKVQQDDDMALAQLKNNPEFSGEFGISRIQRTFKWNYNRAARACDRAVVSGLLKRGSPDEHLHTFN